jgi:acetyl esterase/lipase
VLGRRTLIAGTLGLTAGALTACTGGDVVSTGPTTGDGPTTVDGSPQRYTYGDDPSQWADLYRPSDPGASRGVVVVVHGGFWKATYGASLGAPLAADLAARGWTAWNLEYRRVGNGGGAPQTFDDVAAGIDLLADVPDLDLARVLTLGHSAGGHLATWSAGRDRTGRWRDVRVPVTGVVSQAGVLDLTEAAADGLGAGAVEAFVGGPPSPAYDDLDPRRQLPLDVPVRCVHGRSDTNVPLSQSADYVRAARAAGADAELLEVEGDHFVLIDPGSDVWASTVDLLAELADPSGPA